MSYKLEQPYTDIEKADFIVEYNHKKNLKIVENNNTIFALEANEIMGTDGKPIINPNYETELAQKEAERISKLTCTKRNFALMLQKLGVSYSQKLLLLMSRPNLSGIYA